MSHSKYTTIHANGKVVGQVKGDTFFKTIASNHFLKRPPAIAFDVSSLQDAQKAGATMVQVVNRDTGQIYRATIAHVLDKGFEFDRGFGRQIGLPLTGWMVSKPGSGLQLSMAF